MPDNTKPEDCNNLVEEYKIASEQVFQIEENIWKSAGLIGVGNIASIFISIISEKSIISAVFVGSLTITFTWIWWGIANRWWDIQHTIILRKRHIENRGFAKIQTYIGIRDGIIDSKQIQKLENEIDKIEKDELNTYDSRFKKRGVRQNIKYIAPLVTLIWIFYLFCLVIDMGGLKMNISETLVIQILTYLGFIGIGFSVGVLVGGIRRKKIFNEAYEFLNKMEMEKSKES